MRTSRDCKAVFSCRLMRKDRSLWLRLIGYPSGSIQHMVMPPSTAMVWPVINRDSSLVTYATAAAISSG